MFLIVHYSKFSVNKSIFVASKCLGLKKVRGEYFCKKAFGKISFELFVMTHSFQVNIDIPSD